MIRVYSRLKSKVGWQLNGSYEEVDEAIEKARLILKDRPRVEVMLEKRTVEGGSDV
jgi:hypothetical protein